MRGLDTHGNSMSSGGCPALRGEGEHGGIPDLPQALLGRGVLRSPILAFFLRVEILELRLALKLFLILEPQAVERDGVQGPSTGTRSREERVVDRSEQVLANCLFFSSFIFLPPLPRL